jgi:hypothetical protein
MSKKPSPDGDYSVGYGRPPKATRFKPGQSGNSRGRPRGSQNRATIWNEQMGKLMSARSGNRQVRISRFEAVIHRLLEQALQGDLKAINILLGYDQRFASLMPDPSQDAPPERLSASERKILERLLAKAPDPGGGDE